MSPTEPINTADNPMGGIRMVRPFTRGNLFSRRKHNELVAKVNPLQNIAISWGEKDQVVYSDANVHIQLDRNKQGGGAGGGPVRRLIIESIGADTLTCSDGASTYTVAKPPLLRESLSSRSIDGVTVSYSAYSTANQTRTASATIGGNAASQTEVVSPRYKADDEIFAAQVANSGVEGAPWIDLNVDARAYSRKFTG